jgi:hypothetical protein
MPSDLPIISAPDPFERRTTAQKYGAAYYLGIVGLIVVVALVTWFATKVWTLWPVWRDVYVLHDEKRTDADRIRAAWRLAHNEDFTPLQAWQVVLRKSLPPLARYVIAESLDARIVRQDPRAFALAVAYSKDWPDWLRLLAVRPLLDAAAEGVPLPAEAIHQLQNHPDSVIAAWATATEALRKDATPGEKAAAMARLEKTSRSDPPLRPLIIALKDAIGLADDHSRPERLDAIDGATIWLRSHEPSARDVWRGWTEEDDRLVEDAASELPYKSTP